MKIIQKFTKKNNGVTKYFTKWFSILKSFPLGAETVTNFANFGKISKKLMTKNILLKAIHLSLC